jgi:nitroreductase
MSVLDVIVSRGSIRTYKAEAVPQGTVEKILEAGRYAPSADNEQPWHFIVVTEPEIKKKLSTGRWNSFIKDSAFTVVGCAYMGDDYSRKWSTIDTTIALQNMVIAAWSLGIGSCWVGDFVEAEVKEMLHVPEDWRIISLISFGYPGETPSNSARKPFKEITSYNDFLNLRSQES